MGVYFQDQWAIRRLTLNYGVRYDYFNGRVDASHVPERKGTSGVRFPACEARRRMDSRPAPRTRFDCGQTRWGAARQALWHLSRLLKK